MKNTDKYLVGYKIILKIQMIVIYVMMEIRNSLLKMPENIVKIFKDFDYKFIVN